jgi:hypothetical protein
MKARRYIVTEHFDGFTERVVEATSAAEAIEKAKRHEFDDADTWSDAFPTGRWTAKRDGRPTQEKGR